jgi:glutamyl/glutaminyl-tRNA synthetase
MKLPEKVITFVDEVKGEVSFNTKEFADFVILKADGVPTYYLANVIDDALQQVNYVIRGEEHLSNTPKQIVIYEALVFIFSNASRPLEASFILKFFTGT